MTNFKIKDASFGGSLALAAILCLKALCGFSSQAASISEPGTLFYGKVLGLGSEQVFLVTEGTLDWTILRADGSELRLQTRLFPLLDGQFSYRLRIPHSALVMGLDSSVGEISLRATDETHTHFSVKVNGLSAQVLGPGGSTFDVRQATRASTYRLDLGLALTPHDSDGDGLPDWWKRKFGVTDPSSDPDADGLSNLAEYRAGSDPNHDDRSPVLVTREVRVFSGAKSILNLAGKDLDSSAGQLVYTIKFLPMSGGIHLRKSFASESGADQALSENSSFTQLDVNEGRVIYIQTSDSNATVDKFTISLRDENPEHLAWESSIQLFIYKPAPAISESELAFARTSLPYTVDNLPGRPKEEGPNISAFILGREYEYLISDGSLEITGQKLAVPSSGLSRSEYLDQFLPAFGKENNHVLIGGLGDDQISGGMEDDIVIAGIGNDFVKGGGGSDLFIVASRQDGNDTVEDFSLAENDRIDLTRVLEGTSTIGSHYVQVASSGLDTLVKVNFNGTGAGYNDMVITLAGANLNSAGIEALLQYHIVTGHDDLPQTVSILATRSVASENGPEAGLFTLTRTGSLQAGIAVALQITGAAQNGIDYAFLQTTVLIPAGASSVQIPLLPFADSTPEPAEVVHISLLPGSDYALGPVTSAQVIIEDLAPQISIAVLEPLALRTGLVPAAFLISRGGVIDQSVLVRFEFGGSAVNGVHYNRLNSYLMLAAGQTLAIVEIVPSASLVPLDGPKTVKVTVKPDATYKIGNGSGRVLLLEKALNLAEWRAGYFADSSAPLQAFAQEDPGNLGIPNIFRYAYGLDPLNPDPLRLPRPVIRNGYLTVDINRNLEATDIDLVVELSRDLVSWEGSSTSIEQISPEDLENDPTITTFRVLPGVNGEDKVFMKVRVIQKP